jgi:hypothetical protein
MPCAASAFASATSTATIQANRFFSLHTARISGVPYRSSMGWTAMRTDLLFRDIVFNDPGVGESGIEPCKVCHLEFIYFNEVN